MPHSKITIEGDIDTGKISDGYHTFDELYDHRIMLFIKLCEFISALKTESGKDDIIWRSRKHSDGELVFGGNWFVMGINKKQGEQITYHIPISRWDETDFAETLECAPNFDGHTSADVLKRLASL